jgi:hypothetical protein
MDLIIVNRTGVPATSLTTRPEGKPGAAGLVHAIGDAGNEVSFSVSFCYRTRFVTGIS